MVGESNSGRRLGPILIIGCAFLPFIVFMICGGLLFAPGLIGLGVATIERERIFAEALAEGNASIAYERADEQFRQAYTEEQLTTYFETYPILFSPPRSSASLRTRTSSDGKTLVSTTFEAGGTKFIIYTRKDGEQLRLLGISPAMDNGVPEEFVNQSNE